MIMLFFIPLCALAQNDTLELLDLPDTILPQPAQDIIIVHDLDSLTRQGWKAVDTLKAPRAFIYKVDREYATRYYIALAAKKYYRVWDLLGNYADEAFFTREELDGKAPQELVTRYSQYRGHSGWENSVHERESYMVIWNLPNAAMLFSLQKQYSLEHWWNEFDPSEPDTLAYENRTVINSGSETECQSYSVAIKLKEISITTGAPCETGAAPRAIAPVIYRYSKGKLVKRK
jgi:hypothetical protein